MKAKKQLAAKIMKTSPSKVRFVADALEDIKKAITRSDLRGFIAIGKIKLSGKNEQSRSRARKTAAQKKKGRQRGIGSRKGSKYSIVNKKAQWMARIRVQRKFLQELRERGSLSPTNYRLLYRKSKGGYFRNRRHIKLYITEHRLIESKDNK